MNKTKKKVPHGTFKDKNNLSISIHEIIPLLKDFRRRGDIGKGVVLKGENIQVNFRYFVDYIASKMMFYKFQADGWRRQALEENAMVDELLSGGK